MGDFLRIVFLFASLSLLGFKILAGVPSVGFKENKGQWPQHVFFQAELGAHRVWIKQDELVYQLYNLSQHPYAQLHSQLHGEKVEKQKYLGHNFRVKFVNANKVRPLPASAPEITKFSYFIGNDPKNWASLVSAYSTLEYKNLYNGIDLKIRHNESRLKYDIELEPGRKGENIGFQYIDTWGVKIVNEKLQIKTALGLVEEYIPKAFQLIDGQSVEVPCKYVNRNGIIGFEFPKGLSPSHKTIIDPVLDFFTYSGGGSDNWANTAVSDKLGNSFVAGVVFGSSFPTTSGAFDRTFNDSLQFFEEVYDIGILKFNPTGSLLLACTYLGGSRAETPHSIHFDNQNNLVVMGSTSSGSFPVSPNAFQKQFRGGPTVFPYGQSPNFDLPKYSSGADIFVCKLGGDLQSLLGSTFLGGGDTDGLMTIEEFLVTNYGDQFRGDVLVDNDGSIFVVSQSRSTNFPIRNAIQAQNKGQTDAVIVKLSPNLNQVLWSTYFGGNREDAFYSIQLLANDRIAVCGGSTSDNYLTTQGAYQSASGLSIDGVVSVFNKLNGNLMASTITGTPSYDQTYLIQTDANNGIYVCGQTKGVFPRTRGKYGQDEGGQFIQKFNQNLTQLMWGTTFGTSRRQPNISPTALQVDSCFRIFVAGWGGKINYQGTGFAEAKTFGLPITSDAFKTSSPDSSDFYFIVLNADATDLNFASYFGGNSGRGEHVDGGTSRFSKSGVITQALCGCRDAENNFFQGSLNAYRRNIGSNNCNIGVMKINLLDLKVNFNLSGQIQCPATLTLFNTSQNGENYTWFFGNGDSLVSNSQSITYAYKQPGTYIISLKATNPKTCKKIAFAYDTITIPDPFPFDSLSKKGTYCVGDTLFPDFPELSNFNIIWSPSLYLSNNAINNPIIIPKSDLIYSILIKDELGCEKYAYYQIKNPKLDLDIKLERNFQPCDGVYQIRYSTTEDSSERYIWYLTYGDTAIGKTVERTYTRNGEYPVRLNGIREGCEGNAIDTLKLDQQKITIIPNFESKKKFKGCNDITMVFTNKTLNGEAFIWEFGDGKKSTEANPEHAYEAPGTYKVKLTSLNSGCSEEIEKHIRIEEVAYPNLIITNEDGKNEAFEIKGIQPGWKLEIFNRWGKKVYQSGDYKNNWIPQEINEGVLFYNITYPDGGQCNDWIKVLKP
jgi:PKD repeat protein